jgi:hypothetical protein
LFALATLRRDEAFDFLLSLLETSEQDGAAVISALAIHKSDDALTQRLRERLNKTGSSRLQALFEKEWGS